MLGDDLATRPDRADRRVRVSRRVPARVAAGFAPQVAESTELKIASPAAKRVTNPSTASRAVKVSAFHKTSCRRSERKRIKMAPRSFPA